MYKYTYILIILMFCNINFRCIKKQHIYKTTPQRNVYIFHYYTLLHQVSCVKKCLISNIFLCGTVLVLFSDVGPLRVETCSNV